jgi:hypothetical protein
MNFAVFANQPDIDEEITDVILSCPCLHAKRHIKQSARRRNAKTYDSAPLSCFNDASAKSATIFNQRNEREKVAGDPQMHKQMRNPCG